jgi:uncharacterized protein (TIGR03067 family)
MRRWNLRQFSLRALLGVLVACCVLVAWYANSSRAIRIEKARLAGTWVVIEQDDVISPTNESKQTIEFTGAGFKLLNPKDGFGRFDYYAPDSKIPSRAIYRFEGNRLLVMQAHPGEPRPTKFLPFMTWILVREQKPMANRTE